MTLTATPTGFGTESNTGECARAASAISCRWAFASTFRRNFPGVRLRVHEVLLTAGDRQEFVMSGGVMSWHDLALYLIAQYVGPTAAQAMAKLLMLQWHGDGQAPYITFRRGWTTAMR